MKRLLIGLCVMMLLVVASAQDNSSTRVSVTIIYSNISLNEAAAIVARAKTSGSKPTIVVGHLNANGTIGNSVNIR